MSHTPYQPGTTLAGRYTVTGILGTGGTSGVYRARDTVMNRTVAVKVIPTAAETETAARSFMTEARAAAVLSHPNIVNVYDVLDLEKEKYIIMEYICGITLREYLDYHGHLSVKESVMCAHQILRALHAAHSRGIVHRDIKPGNVLIMTDGRIKVTDFGIARLPDHDSFLMPDRTVGTVHYVSPEQASGGAVDERSDLYSLGILMYEMLTGHRPFEAERPADVAMMQITARPVPPTHRNPNIPLSLEKIVLCALEKDPAARFDSAAEMLRMLDRLPDDVLEGRARPIREEGSAYRMAAERIDDRTLPLPRVHNRKYAEEEATDDIPIPNGGGLPPRTEDKERAASQTPPLREEPAVTPIAPPPPAATPAPPPPTPIGNMMDAFTAEDTMDIMLAPTASAASEAPPATPSAPEEPILFTRRHEETPEEGVGEETVEDMTVELPRPPKTEDAEKKGAKKQPGGMLLEGENRVFGIFMLCAALVLAIILLVGVIGGGGEREEGNTDGTVSVSLPAGEVSDAF